MGFFFTLVATLVVGACIIVGFNSVALMVGWSMLQASTQEGIMGLATVCGTLLGFLVQVTWD